MKYYSKKQWTHKLTVMVLLAMALGGTAVQAMPSGGDIRSGQGSISQDGKNMTVLQNSDRMAIDWTKFDIAKDETVRYAQPDRNAISLNRVTGGQQSVIAGNLNANGNVVLVNPNGVVFTKNSSVDVGGLVASTARLNDEAMKNFGNGKDSLGLSLDKDSTAAVINEGQIKAQGGLVALHAANVENKGTITNEGGTLAMAAAKNLTLSAADDDKLNFTVDGDLAKAQALNSGSLKANGGYVVMTAKSAGDVLSTVVNNSGTIEAKTLRKNEKGQILLDGGDNGQVEVSGTLDASGTEAGQDAGNIKVIGQKTLVHDNTSLLAKGNVDGGKIETSGDVLSLGDGLTIDAGGVNGKHGEWLLDPLEILIQDDQPTQGTEDRTIGTVNEGSGTQITYNDPPSATQNANATYSSTSWIKTKLITDILNKGTDVTIQAASTSQAASITVNSAIKPKVEGDGEATLTLEAQRNITINKEIAADESGGKLNVKLNSDTDGDGVGAVIINADISTNGGTFTSGSGGKVSFKVPNGTADGAYADSGLEGEANIAGHTVGTYFGYVVPEGKSAIDLSGEQNNRKITTNGGAITLDGEVAIGLNGGVLTLDTSKKDGTPGGAVNITGIVNSGNSYDTYIYGTEKWNELVEKLVQEYLDHNSVPSYRFVGINYKKNTDGTYSYTTEAQPFKQGESHYAFHELKSGDVNGTNWTYTDSEPTLDTQHTRWYATTTAGDGYNSFIMEGTTPETSQMSIDEWLIYYRRTEPDNYASKYANGNTDTKTNLVTYDTIKNDATKMATLKSDISALIAHNWFASKSLANPGDKSGANPGDSYLATITTALENSLSTPNSQKTLWVGGMGSGVRNKTNDTKTNPYSQYPADPTHQDGFYWVTGPEGLVTNEDGTTGTKFWDTSKSYWNKDPKKSNYGEQVYGYTKWSSWSGGGQPDNSAPFLTVGYGNNNAWDDAAIDGGTTVGFVQETNLYNSSLNVKTAGGNVTLQGDIGKSVGLDTVKIDAGSGSVTTGNTNNKATKYNNGTIYADHGVYINGGEVTVGGEIHSGGTNVEATKNTDDSFKDYLDNVTIQSSGNLTVHGIEVNASTDHRGNTSSRNDREGGKIKLTSTGTEGVITLGDGVDYNGKNTNGGVLKAASTANDSVVIDAQGAESKFKNETSSTKAIDTQGKWKIYSASPERNTFGKNLNSGTDAQWTTNSTKFAAADSNENKFIFQTTPTITLYVEDKVKTYGDDVTDQLPGYMMNREEFTGVDGSLHNVNEYTDAFQEKEYTNYISIPEGQSITVTSVGKGGADGAVGTATRTGGTHAATEKSGADGKNAVYDLNVNLNGATALAGYNLKTENATLEIVKRQASITGSGTQTYGDTDGAIKNWTDTKNNIANDSAVTYDTSVKSGSAYTDNQKGRNTADYGTYEDSVSFDNLKIIDAKGNEVNIADNYDLTTTGTIDVAKAKLIVNTDGKTTTYGTVDESYNTSLDKTTQALNGDKEADLLQEMGLTYKTDAYQDSDGDGKYDRTNHVKYTSDGKDYDSYTLDVANTNTLKNYEVTVNDSTVTLERAKATVDTDNVTTTYGTVDKNYTSHFNTAVNGDDPNRLLEDLKLTYQTEAYKDDTHTNDVKEGGYDLNVAKTQKLGDYDVTVKNANVTLNKAKLVIDTDSNTKVYGDWKGVKNDVEGAAHIRDEATSVVNGDKAADLMKEMGLTTSSEALIKNADGTYKTNHVKDGGYAIDTIFADTIKNYDVSRGTDGVETLTKAKAVVDTDKVTTTYGTVDKNYTSHFKDALNGDDAEQLLKNLSLTYKTDAYTDDTHTNNVKEGGYNLDVAKTANLGDYEVTVNPSNVNIEKATLVIDTTGGTKDYGNVAGVQADLNKAASFHVKGSDNQTVNGDNEDEIKNALNISVKSDVLVDNETKTNNVNDGGYEIKANYTPELQNYKVETGTVGKEQLNRVDLYVDSNDLTKSYGDANGVLDELNSKERNTLTGLVNGDDKQEDAIRNAIGIKNSSPAVYTKDGKSYTKDVGDYEIKTALTNQTITNYNVKTRNAGKVTLTPKSITVKNTMTQQYGSSEKKFSEATVPADQLANGDTISTKDLKFDIVSGGKYEQSLKANQAEHADAVSADVGNYKGELIHTGGGITHADGTDAYKNYKVTVDGDIVVTPADLTVKINDANTQYGTPFDEESGKKSYDYTVVSGNTNGDTKAEVKNLLGQLKNYKNAGVGDIGRATKDVGSYGITGEQAKKLSNYTVHVEKGTATITPAPLTIKTDHVYTDYGTDYDVTVGKTVSSVEGLTNGDQDKASDISYDYGNYGGGYIEGNTKTNHVGYYDFKTTVGNKSGDFLKNYEITGGDATLTITPKDVYFHVDGKGSTFDDIIYTVTDPNHPGSRDAINSQLPYGETVTGGYGLGQALPGTPGSKDHYYTVDSTINGTPVYDNNGQGTPVGNYVYHPTSQAVIHFDPPQKPDQTTYYVEGARRPQDKIESALPVFRVDARGVVKQYGTYGIESKDQAVTLSPTGMRMPEPNQPSTQDRKYLTTLKTAHGHGTFRLEYNGVVLRVIPVDPAAEQIVTDGDKMKNVALSEQALHVAYTQMGLDLVNLKGVYIYMAPMSV